MTLKCDLELVSGEHLGENRSKGLGNVECTQNGG